MGHSPAAHDGMQKKTLTAAATRKKCKGRENGIIHWTAMLRLSIYFSLGFTDIAVTVVKEENGSLLLVLDVSAT